MSQQSPYIVLRCGGRGGTCSKPVLVPLHLFDHPEGIEGLMAHLREVGWAMLKQEMNEESLPGGGYEFFETACPTCLMAYLSGRLQEQTAAAGAPGPLAKAALEGALSEPEPTQAEGDPE